MDIKQNKTQPAYWGTYFKKNSQRFLWKIDTPQIIELNRCDGGNPYWNYPKMMETPDAVWPYCDKNVLFNGDVEGKNILVLAEKGEMDGWRGHCSCKRRLPHKSWAPTV